VREDKYLIGIDMGATNLRVGLVKNGQIINKRKVKINRRGKAEDIINQIVHCIETINVNKIHSIGIGVPSIVDVKKGIVYDVVNIPSWKRVHLKEILENRFNIPVNVNNDSNCFAIGEKYFGKGQGYESLIGITVGSGLGSGVILDGKLYCGPNSGAGEIGMISYKDSIIEQYASGQFFEEFYSTDGHEIFCQAKRGNKRALDAYEEFGTHLGEAIKVIMYMYDPEIIILGGAISLAYSYFKRTMQLEICTFPFTNSLKALTIEVSERKDIAVLGAAVLAFEKEEIELI
jgi:glucokinase